MDRIDLFFFVVLILYLSYERFRDIATIETPVSVLLLYDIWTFCYPYIQHTRLLRKYNVLRCNKYFPVFGLCCYNGKVNVQRN